MTTVQVTGIYTVNAGQTLTFHDETAFQFADSSASLAVFNYGNVVVNDTNATGTLRDAIFHDYTSDGAFWNEAGATFSMTSTGPNTITGYYGVGYYQGLTEMRNSGLFSVTASNASATGVYVEGTQISFDNDGTLDVTGTAGVGVMLSNYAKMSNSGLIDVEGSAIAIGVTLSFYMGMIDNSGTIIAHGPDASSSYAIQITATAFQVPITNSGTIEGRIDFSAAGFGAGLLTNTGHIVGNVTFADTDGGYGMLDDNDIVHNDGTIDGNLHLGVNNDTLDGTGTVRGIITGDMGDDMLTAGGGNDVIYGDSLVQTAQDGNDTIHAGAGDDVIIGGGGNDLIDGGSGSDTASYANAPGGVTVSLAVTTAQDTGAAGSDTITNVENLTGSAFNDTLTGGTGDNVLTGGGGNDTLAGGEGTDIAAYSGLHTEYTVAGGGTPTSVSDVRAGTPDGTDTLTGIEQLQFGEGTFVYDNAGSATATQADTDGTKTWSSVVTSFDSAGSLTGQTIVNDNGTHWVNSYDPANAQGWTWKVDAYDASNRLVSQSGQNDDGGHWLTLNDINNQYAWTTATIQYDANWNTVAITGTNDDNSHTVSAISVEGALDGITWFATPYDPNFAGAAQDTGLGGGSENDLLYGHAGNDALDGGAGNDFLIGGGGDDLLTGGAGNDRFVFRASETGNDTIADFSAGDVIELHGYGIANFAALQPLMSLSGGDTVITIDTMDHIMLHGITPAQLAANAFLFT